MRPIALIVFLAACGGSSGPTTTNPDAGNSDAGYPSAVTLELGPETGSAAMTTIAAAGTPVQWHNADATAHSCEAVGPQFLTSTGEIAAGATSAPQTLPAGTYRYRCGAMQGTLIVQ
jgi:plastocyanin